MKASSKLIIALAVGFAALQGCAQTGGVAPDAGAQATSAPVPAAQAPAPTTNASAAAIPEDNGKPVVKADTKENFEAIVAAIHQQMQPGGRWQFVDKSERDTLESSFADMDKLYTQFGSVDKMDDAGKVRLLADQSTVNAILTKKDGERLICTSEMPVGSHLPIRTCRTYAQIQAEQRGAQTTLLQLQQKQDFQEKEGH